MKTTLTSRIRSAGVGSMLAVAGAIGLVIPTVSAAPAEPCVYTVIGEDGQPVTVACNPSPLPDTMAPRISINNPLTTSLKRGQPVTITALASDNVGVVTTQIYVNAALLASQPNGTAGTTWTPTQRGTYTITAKAFDAAGNVGTANMVVTVR